MLITGNITKNFSLIEMMNKESKEKIQLVITPQLVSFALMIQELRDYYQKPMNVSSWYRTKKFNANCGGSPYSAHLDGRAVDILIPTADFNKLIGMWKNICLNWERVGGVNLYTNYMHFTDYQDKFGATSFEVRIKR